MIRLVEEFLDKYFEVEDNQKLFSDDNRSVPDAVVTSGGVIVSPDEDKGDPRIYTFGPNATKSVANTSPEQLKAAVNNAEKNPKISKVEIKGPEANIADVYNPELGKYVSEMSNEWDSAYDEYKAQRSAEVAKAAVEDYLLGKKSGISNKASKAAATVDNKWTKERNTWQTNNAENL